MKSIFASLESYVKSIVKNMRLSMGKLTGSPQMSPFLHAMSIYEVILKQLNTDSFHELSHDAVSQMKKNTQRNQNYISATAPFAQSTTLPFDFDPSSDEDAPAVPPPDVNRDGNFEDAQDHPPPDASATASYTESLISRI